ncbi:hypothetical protein [Halomarina pelagica]|uniref:Cap15 family cyclic dinucleotide receptor domain-containing protein n=1 Tax=Halomarina pelagica TaxID=2961599 RepID=UPI0020C1C723|nr:hypothetical protein [Halomarina sp. BND7]
MHTYSTDNELRPKILGGIGVICYIIVGLLSAAVSFATQNLAIGVAIGVPSWGVVFAIGLKLFDSWLWDTAPVRRLRLVKAPNLSGEWEGWIGTFYDGDIEIPEYAVHAENDPEEEYTRLTATLTVEQTWRKIGIHLKTKQSSSDSEGATILTTEGKWPSLNYQYENNPPPDTPETMQMHHGTADLELKETPDKDILEGIYYTGPGRDNHGLMWFKRVE